MPVTQSVTKWLIQWSAGDETALERLTPFVYEELRRLAAHYLRSERPDHTLQATALVHEAYLELLDFQHIEWRSRAHFIGIAAQMMRRILVDHARTRAAQKRGGEEIIKLPLSRAERVAAEQKTTDLVLLDEALERFAADYPRQAQVVELKFFGGLKTEEIANLLSADKAEVSTRTVERDWRFARAWLLQELSSGENQRGCI
jgi:RNA polymerase sigma factor (TIGR02999 family)